MEGYASLRAWAKALIGGAAALTCVTAHAQDNGIFIGASAADVSTDFDLGLAAPAYDVDDETSGFKLIGGIRPLDPFALEFNYVDLGEMEATLADVCPPAIGGGCPGSVTFDATALSVSAVGYVSLPFIDLFGRAGVARWESEREIPLLGSATERGTDMTYGAGAQVRFLSFAVRLEYERFELDRDSVDTVSVGFTYTFL
jgi:opacity protein-like surface antigen